MSSGIECPNCKKDDCICDLKILDHRNALLKENMRLRQRVAELEGRPALQPSRNFESLREAADLGRTSEYWEDQWQQAEARVKELEGELRMWFGCPHCMEDHLVGSMCPPHEVRITGQDWFKSCIREARQRATTTSEALESCRAALKFYAEGKHYSEKNDGGYTVYEVEECGEMAQEALAQLPAQPADTESSYAEVEENYYKKVYEAAKAFVEAYDPGYGNSVAPGPEFNADMLDEYHTLREAIEEVTLTEPEKGG